MSINQELENLSSTLIFIGLTRRRRPSISVMKIIFYSGNLCFVEWPEKIENLLPEDAVKVTIQELPDGSREVTLE